MPCHADHTCRTCDPLVFDSDRTARYTFYAGISRNLQEYIHSALVPSAGADGRETSEGPELVQRLGLVRLVTVSAYRSCRRPQDQTE